MVRSRMEDEDDKMVVDLVLYMRFWLVCLEMGFGGVVDVQNERRDAERKSHIYWANRNHSRRTTSTTELIRPRSTPEIFLLFEHK